MSTSFDEIVMTPIGRVSGGRAKATKDDWGRNRCSIVLRDDLLSPDAVKGLDAHSHVEVVFHFHIDADEPIEAGARHPRGRTDWPEVGIYAQHGRMRRNRIGVSICRLLKVDGLTIEVEGLDAVDGTPVLDIKPVWSGYRPRGAFREPDWARELMANYWEKPEGGERK